MLCTPIITGCAAFSLRLLLQAMHSLAPPKIQASGYDARTRLTLDPVNSEAVRKRDASPMRKMAGDNSSWRREPAVRGYLAQLTEPRTTPAAIILLVRIPGTSRGSHSRWRHKDEGSVVLLRSWLLHDVPWQLSTRNENCHSQHPMRRTPASVIFSFVGHGLDWIWHAIPLPRLRRLHVWRPA